MTAELISSMVLLGLSTSLLILVPVLLIGLAWQAVKSW